MPSTNSSPLPAIASRFDARTWSGVTLLSLNASANTTALPTYAATAGVYDDPLAFLTGYGMPTPAQLGTDLDGLWSGAAKTGDITAGIDADDMVFIHCTDNGGGAEAFTVTGSSANRFGFHGAIASVTDGAGGFIATATHDWVRGGFNARGADVLLIIDPDSGGAPLVVPNWGGTVQSVPTILRETGAEGDDDDGHDADNLCSLLNDDHALITRTIRCGINDTGHVWITGPTSAFTADIVWSSTTFRDRLGFSGSEVSTTASSIRYVTADYPLPGFLAPTRGLTRISPRSLERSAAVRAVTGILASTHLGSYRQWDIAGYLDGPADARDLHDHAVRKVWPYLVQGREVTVWQEWGDPRRAINAADVTASIVSYSAFQTSDDSGYRGRRRLIVSPDGSPGMQVNWPDAIRRRAPWMLIASDNVNVAR